MAAFTVGVELGAGVFSLWRRTAQWLLFAAILMHLGIMGFTGIFFWKWIVIDLLLIWGIRKSRRMSSARANWHRVAALAVLIACFPLYATPKWLGWVDTHLSEQYLIEVQTRTGDGVREYRVHQADMSPFDITIEQGDFHYANSRAVVTSTWGGVKDFELGRELNRELGEEEIRALVTARGEVRFDEKKAAELDRFLRTYFTNVNARDGEMRWLNWIGPPTHMQARSGGERYDFKTRVVKVRVRFVRTYFDGEKIIELDNFVIREVEISE